MVQSPRIGGAPDAVNALMAYLQGFVRLGGFFLQLDVVDEAMLRAPRENPGAYRTLLVRVSGWNARFMTLDANYQNTIIERVAQRF